MNVSSSDWTTRYAVFGFESSKLTMNSLGTAARRTGPSGEVAWRAIRSCSESITTSWSWVVSALRNRSVFRATFSRFGRLFMTDCIIDTWLMMSRSTAMPWSSGFSSDSVST